MPEAYLASSALIAEGFDGNRTVEEAVNASFDGVQLFLDERYKNPDYRRSVIHSLRGTNLGIVLHLPNITTLKDIAAASEIVYEYPNTNVLIHYLPETSLPKLDSTVIGWENSLVCPLNSGQIEHIAKVKCKVQEDKTFFVFDMGRLLYTDGNTSEDEAISFIRREIKCLNPQRDIIHLADKATWTSDFRESMCTLGQGVMREFLGDIKQFSGIIVFEHEDLQMAIDSLKVAKS